MPPTYGSRLTKATPRRGSSTAAIAEQTVIHDCLRSRAVASGVTTAATKKPAADAANARASPAGRASTSSGSWKQA